jgi:CDP-glycerol glycerophosphotransferase
MRDSRGPRYHQELTRVMANIIKQIKKELGLFLNIGKYAEQECFLANYGAAAIDPDLAFFESFWGSKITCNPYAMYRQMRDDPALAHMRFVWSAEKGASIPADVEGDPRTSLVPPSGVAFAKALLTAKYLISNSTLPDYYTRHPDQIYANTWHGVPLKFMGYDADPRPSSVANSQHNFIQATHIFMAGDYAADKTVKPYGAFDHTCPKIVQTGSPRVDLTLSANGDAVKQRLGLAPGRKLILYAPTWRGMIDDINKDADDLRAAMKAIAAAAGPQFEVAVSAHNFVRAQVTKDAPEIRQVPDNIDVNEVLAAADVLVSDYSSIIVDYLVLDRPVVLYVPDREQYEKERGLYVSLDDLPAAVAMDAGSLAVALARLAAPSTFATYHVMRRQLVPLEDGNAAKRAVAAMLAESPAQVTDARHKRIAIHPGNLKTNGITSSFLNLLTNINRSGVHSTVLLSVPSLDRTATSLDNFSRIEPSSQIIIKRSPHALAKEERRAFRRWMRKREFTSMADLQTLRTASLRECRRYIGDFRFDAAIDFGGYAERWSLLMGHMPARSRAIYQHNDLHAEATNHDHYRDMEHLFNVFETYKLYDRVISVSPELMKVNAGNLASYYRTPDAARSVRNTIVPEAIRKRAVQSLAKAAPGIPEPTSFKGMKCLAMLGRLSPEKNPMRMLEALRIALDGGHKLVLYIIGDGPLQEAVAAHVRKLDLVRNVVLCGPLQNPFPLLKACDCLVMSSDYEGQPMVILEAMTLGKGVIACDIPGTRNSLHGGYGHLVEKTPAGLARGFADFAMDRLQFKTFDAEAYVKDCVAEFLAQSGIAGEP